jgi:hypothetical protein
MPGLQSSSISENGAKRRKATQNDATSPPFWRPEEVYGRIEKSKRRKTTQNGAKGRKRTQNDAKRRNAPKSKLKQSAKMEKEHMHTAGGYSKLNFALWSQTVLKYKSSAGFPILAASPE